VYSLDHGRFDGLLSDLGRHGVRDLNDLKKINRNLESRLRGSRQHQCPPILVSNSSDMFLINLSSPSSPVPFSNSHNLLRNHFSKLTINN